ncbi:uncharacterized protein LOC123895675 isoform X1 [Trifolium pratense]|uniref:uncharacterized protein LOC123895675 isoform X1 n=1 Tax=Trifolium pratense TaxID=57577 RepID=UPI001E691C70|nr:uncharacterized protein LOC123895675 isoform X1 [Trifolium pratense]XP_045802096.1 uncharacterized protein LOC123895675 isoform X1 [Trifolium pratense]XP_045802097.1 uncharacterized protein LOC123895675 isoform X1 [Trifolium pratense]
MASLVDCYHFLLPPRVKARLKEFLVHLKLYEARHRELKAKIQNLKKARDSVQRKVDEEDNRYGNGIPREVADWIKAVDTIISECDEFDEDEDHQLAVFDLFKSGYLPKTGIRYRLSTKAFAITSKVNGLLQTAKHDTYSYWLGPPSIASFFHTVGYESFPSREESMKKIKEALKSPNVRVIGLHGLSGVGKTTLVKKIARDALQASEADKMFDVVAMSSITRNPDIRQIQGHIADALGMKLDEESDIARAARIRRRLKNESTLIILDDLWAALDLNMLGIPLDVDDGDGQHILTETAKEISSGNVREGKIPGLFSKTETTNEISSGNVREGKIPGLLTKTKTMKEIPFGNLKEGKIPGEHRKTKTMKEIPYGNVNEGKSSGEHSKRKSEGNNSVVNMMKSRKLPSASNMKTEETLSHYKGCKVLLISESKQVLLSHLEGKEDSIYFINVLKEKESETFFKKMAGIGNGKTEFDKLTMSIVHKCNGLPMSIVTTARALKNQSCSVWEDVHRHLERGNLTGVSDFSTKLSYDLLEDEELKYAFLLCARMGPDALIVDLVKYCIGLGFLQEIYTVKEARDRVYVLVGKLKVFGLLSDSYSSDHFTMQDIVRSAALSIASKEKHVFTKTNGKIDEWPDKLESYAAISLHHCHIIDGFPREINYPRLRFFQVNNNDPHLKIPKNFFEGMKELRVLLLTGIRISPLDSSIASLTELKMLAFEQCMLDKKLSVIGELKKLRILSFSGSDIEKLPVELKQLKKLQIFDISNCSKLTNIPSNVISSLISLEELYMRNTLIQWKVEEQNYQSENASLTELRHLNQLTTLDIHISDAAHLPKNLFFDKLYSYKIVVGDMNAYSDMDAKMPEKYEASRFLAIQLKKGCNIHSQKGIKMLFERVETLFLEELNGVKDIFFRLSLKGFPYLKHLLIVNNSDIQSLINPEDRQHTEKAFPKLESLHLYNLKSISEICSCKLSAPSFRKLKVIKINLCGKLTSVVLFSVVSLLTVLETIEVSECNTLMAIVASETESNSNERGVLNFPELRTLTLMSLPELIGFYPISSEGEDGAKATELFDEKVELPKLERMVLSSIQINKVWSDQSMQISCFKNLIHMDVNGCWNLDYLISFSMAKSLVNLQSLFVSECEKMSYIFPQGQGSHAKMKGSVFPNLKSIKLSSMKSLLEIWNFELPSNSFEKLDTLIIEECDKLVNVFPCYVAGMFRSLCNLRVTNCKSMKLVFELDDKKRNEVDVTNMQDVYLETLPKLEHVWKWSKDRVGILELKSLQKMCVHDCYRLENIFPVSVARLFPILEYLVIRDCFELREIVPKRYSTNDTSNLGPFFEFPNLTTIKFSDLPKLSGFYPGAYKLSCPALNDLTIELCDRLEPFKKETTEAQTRSTIFSKEVINKLKCMHIESWHAKLSSSYLRERNHRQDNLEELCLSRLMNPGILYSFLHRSPNLKSLSLSNCFVTDIVPHKMPPEIENLGVVPKLEKLMLLDMPDLETIGFEEGIILERIELLILKQCPLLVNIMPSSVSLTHLTNLEVVSCGGLKILMPLSAAKSLVQLNSMKVVECESMEEIVGNENENGGEVDKIVENENVLKVDIVFRKLRVLELLSLKKLNSFSKSCVTEFPSMEKLVVSACPKMESFSEKVQSSPLLEKIFVHENEKIWCWNDDLNTTIQEIFKEKRFLEGMEEISLSEHHDLQILWNCGVGDLEKSWFYNLKTLRLEDCDNLSCAIPSNIFLCLKSLKELEVRNCNKVGQIFGNLENDNMTIRSQLKNLTLEGLSDLKHVWGENYQGNLIFQNLLHVSVIDCDGLKTLFPAAVAKNIKKLETLQIESCQNLLEIVGKEVYVGVAADDTEKFVFPCLTSLDLNDLPELTYFYCEIFTVECPELHVLIVLDCPRLELFQSACLESESEGNSTSINRQPLFSNLQAISFLEELSVDWEYSSVLGSSLEGMEDLKLLKDIQFFFDVDDIVNPTLPFGILSKAPNLQEMSIEWCKSFEIFQTANIKTSEQLKTLTLNNVSELKFIWSEDSSWLNIVCEKLYNLNVTCCPGLTKLSCSPSAVSFSHLKELYIEECHGLEYLFTSSVAKVLMHLEKITVKESESIKEIIEMEQDGTTSLVVKFERLISIVLDSLSSLEYFYSGSDTLQLPSLTLVNIQQCPKMDCFSRGGIIAKSFKGIQNSVEQNDELIFHNDLNVSVKMVFLLQMLSEGMDGTEFSKHPELRDAWQDGLCTQNNWFYGLRTLKLVNCDIKPYAIPSNILPCLNSLKDLEVRNCNKVEVIFAKNDTDEIPSQLNNLTLEDLSGLKLVWEKNFEGILQFQNLKQVSCIGCKSIQTLFPVVLAENLKMLDDLKVKSCHELREIVGMEDAATGLEKKFSFSHLTSLDLYDLPEFRYFYPKIFTVVCPKLSYFSVVDCPKLEVFQGAHAEGEAESISTSTNRQPLIPNLNVISILEELVLDWKHISVLRLGQQSEDLKYLKRAFLYFNEVEKNEKPTFPLEIFEKVPNLQDLLVGWINSVEIFLTKNANGRERRILGQLKFLELHTVYELQYINLEDSWLNIVIEKLHRLKLSNCPDLEKIFHSPCAVSFSYMKELYVSNCHGLRYLFTCSVAKALPTLEKLTVEESQSITEIIAKEQDGTTSQGVKFERLCYIFLNSLSSLECFYSGNGSLQLPSLSDVYIWQCPNLKVFSSGEIDAKSFIGVQASSDSNDPLVLHNDFNASVRRVFLLQMLSEGMDGTEFSKHPELLDAWQDRLCTQNNWFYGLRTLKLVNCDIKPYAIPSNILPCLNSLKDLEVRNCNKVEVIFAKNDTDEIPSQLNNLTLEDLSGLKLVWEKNFEGILQFQNLKQVSCIRCKSIQTLFPVVLAENLKMLDDLKVKSCHELREIVGMEDAATGLEKKFSFSHLTSLDLHDLPEFRYFYPEIFTVVCPKLSYFSVVDCPKLEVFQGAHAEGEAESISTSTNRQPLIPNLNAISILEQLVLDWKHISVLRLGQQSEDLKYLKKAFLYFNDVEKKEKPTFPLEIFEKVPNLQDLLVGWINSVEIFLTKNANGRERGILGQLEFLELHTVYELHYINLEDSWLNIVIEKLHRLKLSNCPDLEKIFHSPCAVSFSYMKELYVSNCHGLRYLFTCSVAKALTTLEKLTVEESQSITEIIAKEQDGTTSQGVKFERLCYIFLNSLSSLECFYSGNGSLQLPSLSDVSIWQCPNLKVFSSGEIDANFFKGIDDSSDLNDELVLYNNDLNASVKRVFLLQMLSEGMDGSEFSKHPELLEAWQDGLCTQNSWFYNLRTLKLVNCDIKPYAIPSNILPCLNSLKDLEVRNCNKVEVIFAKNDTDEIPSQLNNLILEDLSELKLVWEKNFQGILQFQNLKQVSVIGCKSIQTLFPAVLAENLKMLDKLEVKSCVELREIVGEEDVATGLEKTFLFPHLASLDLYKLPEFTYFYPGIFTAVCPKLRCITLMGSPKLELFEGAHSTSTNRQPVIPNIDAIPMLEELCLDWKHLSVLRIGQESEDLIYLKKTLLCFDGVEENEKPSLPLEIFEKAPNLQDLQLGWINSLEIFLIKNTNSREHMILGQLKILTLDTVSELQYINLDDSWLNTVIEKLHNLKVTNCPDLKYLIHSPCAVSFSCMKELHISGCHGLRYLFTCSMAKVLKALEKITVEESRSITEIVAKEQDQTTSQGVKFEQLCYIYLNSLKSLECFYSGNGSLQLPSLTRAYIWQCPKLKVFSSGEIIANCFQGIQALPDLNDELVLYNNNLNASVEKLFLLKQEHLVFVDSHLLKSIWLKSETVPNWCFCNLISLVVEGCEFLADAVLPSHLLPFLSNLKTLEVRNCNSIKAIFVNTKVGPQGCLGLPLLEKLYVGNCKELLEIVAKEETDTEDANKVITIFPKITYLMLLNLYNLRCIYPGVHILEWPILKELHVVHCPILKFFTTVVQSSRDLPSEYQDSFPTIQQTFVSLEKVTPSLKVLTLGKEEAKMMEQGKLHVDLQELNILRLQCFHDKTDVFPFVFHSKVPLPSTKYLLVGHSAFIEIFPAQTPDVDYTKILSQLKTLELKNLPKLESIGFEHSWMRPFVENLQTIHVLYCDSLTNLTPSIVSFSKLKKLNVQNCHGIKYLFTSSTAKTLTVLKEMKLVNCKSIIAIVAKEGDEPNEGEMLFMELSILTLSSLPKLGSFYSGSFTLSFSSLKEVSFTQCNSTKVFRLGDKVPDELKVTIDGVVWESDKNEVLMQQIDEEA